MTKYEYEKNELERDLSCDEPEILRDDLPFEADTLSSDDCMYEGLALGDDNHFFGD